MLVLNSQLSFMPKRAYVADLYRAESPVRPDAFDYLAFLDGFDLLCIKTLASRTLELCPARDPVPFSLSAEAAEYLASLGIKGILCDTALPGLPEAAALAALSPGYYDCEKAGADALRLVPATMPYGVRRDGSYFMRIQWANGTVKNPYYWVCNLIDDDVERFGGTWGANTASPANVILDFFGERQQVQTVRVFNNWRRAAQPSAGDVLPYPALRFRRSALYPFRQFRAGCRQHSLAGDFICSFGDGGKVDNLPFAPTDLCAICPFGAG